MRIYIVTVEAEMAVYAETEQEAKVIAQQNTRYLDAFCDFSFAASCLQKDSFVDADLLDSSPYSKNNREGRTVREILEEQGDWENK